MSAEGPPLLATIDAALNLTAAVLMTAGYAAVRAGRILLHRRLMLAAVAVSALFLVCYLYYHATHEPVRYQGSGWARLLYLLLLGSHTVLAAATVPLVLTSVWLGLRDRIDRHRQLVRYALPIWWYVSVSGVVVYIVLYHLG